MWLRILLTTSISTIDCQNQSITKHPAVPGMNARESYHPEQFITLSPVSDEVDPDLYWEKIKTCASVFLC